MSKTSDDFLKFIGMIGLVIISIIIRGFLLSTFWIWFVVPIFQVRAISIAEAIGLSMTIGLFMLSRVKNKNEDESILQAFFILLFLYAFVYFAGWILTLFL